MFVALHNVSFSPQLPMGESGFGQKPSTRMRDGFAIIR